MVFEREGCNIILARLISLLHALSGWTVDWLLFLFSTQICTGFFCGILHDVILFKVHSASTQVGNHWRCHHWSVNIQGHLFPILSSNSREQGHKTHLNATEHYREAREFAEWSAKDRAERIAHLPPLTPEQERQMRAYVRMMQEHHALNPDSDIDQVR